MSKEKHNDARANVEPAATLSPYVWKRMDGGGLWPVSAEPVIGDGYRTCAIADSNYASGMLTGWNLCIADDETSFNRIRGDRMRAAAQASQVNKMQSPTAPVAAQVQPNENAEWEADAKKQGQDTVSGLLRWNPLHGGGMNPHPNGMYVRFDDLAKQPVSGADGVREALEETQTLLAAMLHESRPITEIMAQMLENRAALNNQPQLYANPEQLDHLPDAAQMNELSGNATELPELPDIAPTDDWDSVLDCIKKYGVACYQAALQTRPQNIPEIIPESAQQDADKVDAALAEMVHAMFRSGNSVPVTRITIDRKQYEAAIGAARKEQA